MNQTNGRPGPSPTLPAAVVAQLVREAVLREEREQYAGRSPITEDDITNLRIILGTSRDVLDVIERA